MEKISRLALMVLLAMVAFGAALPTRGRSQFYPAAEGRFGRRLRPTGIFAAGSSTASGVTVYPAGVDEDGARLAQLFRAGGNLLLFLGSLLH